MIDGLNSFHGSVENKQMYVERVELHVKHEDLRQGVSWKNNKGCAIGCTIHDYDHDKYETELGLPIQLAFIEEVIFENLSPVQSRKFPLDFIKAIPIGKDLNYVWIDLMIWIMGQYNSKPQYNLTEIIGVYESLRENPFQNLKNYNEPFRNEVYNRCYMIASQYVSEAHAACGYTIRQLIYDSINKNGLDLLEIKSEIISLLKNN